MKNDIKKSNRVRLNYLNSHKRPVSRREFISMGLMAGGGLVAAPTIGSLFLSPLSAEASTSAASGVPFLVFDLAGGAALPANFLVGKVGGPKDLLNSYDQLGWDPKTDGFDERFGLPMPKVEISFLLQGLLNALSADAQKNLRFSSLSHIGQTDTSSNPLSALSLAVKAGATGSKLVGSCGLKASSSGGNSILALDGSSYRPFFVPDLSTLQRANDFGGRVGALGFDLRSGLVDLLRRLSETSARDLLGTRLSKDELSRIDATYSRAVDAVRNPIAIDPRVDPIVSAVYGFNGGESETNQNVLRAAIVNGVLSGQTGPGVITIDGCDYHDSTVGSGEQKDFEIGVEIGRAVELAHRLGKPLFFQVITDGGIYPDAGTRRWIGDRVESCMSVMGYFNPAAVPKYRSLPDGSPSQQIGHYTDGQGADRATLIGESPLLSAYAVAANYLSIQGRLGEFTTLFPSTLSGSPLDSVIAFES